MTKGCLRINPYCPVKAAFGGCERSALNFVIASLRSNLSLLVIASVARQSLFLFRPALKGEIATFLAMTKGCLRSNPYCPVKAPFGGCERSALNLVIASAAH